MTQWWYDIFMNKRQEEIIRFAKTKNSFKNKDVVSFFNEKFSRETITRDLSFLTRKNFLKKSGAGAFVIYCLSDKYSILEEIDIKKYFETPYLKREARESFNFEILSILEEDIFTVEEKHKLENLQKEFVENFSKYDSQTLINKEFERIMIEFSWKSSAIEGNTYSLLGTEALIKNSIVGEGKTKEEA